MFSRILIVLPFAAAAFAQLTPNSVTVTATKSISVQPDQVVFGLTLRTPLDVSRDEAFAAVQSLVVTPANFTGVTTYQSFQCAGQASQPMLAWSFTYTADFSNMKTAISSLNALQQTIAQRKNGMALDYSVQGAQVSSRLAQAQTCALSDLMSDARAQALKLASAASMSVGSVLAISSPTIGGVVSSGLTYTGSTAGILPVCSMTVKFALGAF